MRILIYLSHPAQFHFYRNAVNILREKGHHIILLAKTKDVLTDLLNREGWEYYNVLPRGRGKSRLSVIMSLLKRDIILTWFAAKHKVNLLAGSDASLAHAARLLGKQCITTLEDDFDVIRNLANLTYPYTSTILVPDAPDVGKWKSKKVGYPGYMKLAYLHPRRFMPDPKKAGVNTTSPYFLIRLSALSAHHDYGIKGISFDLLDEIIDILVVNGNLYISSEHILPDKYRQYTLEIPAYNIHHCLAFTRLLICDSQSMTVEAAMLGVPSVRISDFSSRISVLEELENKYLLTFGFKPHAEKEILEKIKYLVQTPGIQCDFQKRRMEMLKDKIDVTSFLVWFIENYPESKRIMQENQQYAERFR